MLHRAVLKQTCPWRQGFAAWSLGPTPALSHTPPTVNLARVLLRAAAIRPDGDGCDSREASDDARLGHDNHRPMTIPRRQACRRAVPRMYGADVAARLGRRTSVDLPRRCTVHPGRRSLGADRARRRRHAPRGKAQGRYRGLRFSGVGHRCCRQHTPVRMPGTSAAQSQTASAIASARARTCSRVRR
jgi:hypothetical protein